MVHGLCDILLPIDGVVDHDGPELQQLQRLGAEVRVFPRKTGFTRAVHGVEVRLDQTDLTDLFQQYPVPGYRLACQLQVLGPQGGDAALPFVPRLSPRQGRVIGPDQVIGGVRSLICSGVQVRVSFSGQRPSRVYTVSPSGMNRLGQWSPKKTTMGGLGEIPQGVGQLPQGLAHPCNALQHDPDDIPLGRVKSSATRES